MKKAKSKRSKSLTSPAFSAAISEYIAYVGLDWADRKHDVCLYDPELDEVEHSVIDAQPEAIDAWAESLRKRFGGGRIAVCTEQKRGPLIYALSKYEFLVLYPVNPQTVSDYRHAFSPSRAKDDPVDAHLMLELIIKHREKLQVWQPSSAQVRMLNQLVESRRMLVGEKVRITNRMSATLKRYYPQVLEWFDDTDTPIFCSFLEQYPSLKVAQAAPREELEAFFRSRHVTRSQTIKRRLDQIRSGVSLTEDSGIIEPSQLLMEAFIAQLKSLLHSIAEFDRKIETVFTALPDAQIFAALPGAGSQLAPRLLVAFGEDRNRYESAQDILRFSGISPVQERSGQKSWVHWRWACPKFLRQTFVEWAAQSRQYSIWADAFYKLQRQNGKTHHMAIRALAYKWIRIIFRCWKDRVPYDEAKYLMSLKKKGSPLVKQLAA